MIRAPAIACFLFVLLGRIIQDLKEILVGSMLHAWKESSYILMHLLDIGRSFNILLERPFTFREEIISHKNLGAYGFFEKVRAKQDK